MGITSNRRSYMNKNDVFMNVTNHGFCRVAVVVPKVNLSNPMANAQEYFLKLSELNQLGVEYAVFPELGLTGYSNLDLFHSFPLIAAAEEALEYLVDRSAEERWDIIFSVGLPLCINGSLYNCAVTVYRGGILAVAPKTYLPNY